jgi:hypothetical protein
MALQRDIKVYSIKVDCQQLASDTLGKASQGQKFSHMYMHVPTVILDHMTPEVVQQYISLH